MRFKFPLATVLRVREILEKREERALQAIQLEMAHVLRKIEELRAEIAQGHTAREVAMREPIPAAQLNMLIWATQAAVEKREALLRHLQVLEKRRDQQMTLYKFAHRNRETLTEMEDKQRSAFDQEEARLLQKSLDDIFIARRHRS